MSRQRAEKIEFEEKLIELVKTKPAIWKKSHPDHGNCIAVGNAWNYVYDQICPSAFAEDGNDCATAWKKIWSQWLAYKRKLITKSGQSSKNPPFFRHARTMSYFQDPVETDTMSSSISNVESDGEGSEHGTENTSTPDDGQETSNESRGETIVTINRIEPPSQAQTPVRPSLSKKQKLDPFGEQLLEVVKGKEMSEYQYFCSSVALKMAKIAEKNPRAAVELQQKIQYEVYEAELALLS